MLDDEDDDDLAGDGTEVGFDDPEDLDVEDLDDEPDEDLDDEL